MSALGWIFSLDVQGRRVHHQVGEVLLILASPDQLGVQVTVASLVGQPDRAGLLIPHQRLVLGARDVDASIVGVGEGLHLDGLPGLAAVTSSGSIGVKARHPF